jgi:hypothetical protein
MMDSNATSQHAHAATAPISTLGRRLHLGWVRKSGMAGLLVLLVTTVFILPIVIRFETTWRVLSDIMVTLLLVCGVAAVADHRKLTIVLAVLSAMVVIFRWTEWIVPRAELSMMRDVSVLMALVVLSATIAINVFASKRALHDRIYGAVALYLLIGLSFASVYAMITIHAGGAFAGPGAAGGAPSDWVYFSFVTLTTVGFGDITPVSHLARSLAILEALVGQLYPAVIIARLISLSPTTLS